MKKLWKIIYYETRSGECEIYDFINKQKERDQVKILSWISLLEERGPNLPRPYADILKNGIHELRLKLSGKQIRILYFFCYKNFIILTNVFIKKAEKVPQAEIKKSETIRKEFLSRYEEKKLKEEYDENI